MYFIELSWIAMITLFTFWKLIFRLRATRRSRRRLPRYACGARCHVNYKRTHCAIPQRKLATGGVLKTFIEDADREMMGALATADNAFVSWEDRPIGVRAMICFGAVQILHERKEQSG
jgi:hypothetical protein